MTIGTGERIATLDIVRGVAVMGILAMNIVAFADVPAAYFNPLAQTVRGSHRRPCRLCRQLPPVRRQDARAVLLPVRRVAAADERDDGDSALVRRRLFWLLLFGAAHFFLIWWGDILVTYAAIGFLALAFRNAGRRALVTAALILIAIQFAIYVAMTLYSFRPAGPGAGRHGDRRPARVMGRTHPRHDHAERRAAGRGDRAVSGTVDQRSSIIR